ncbi:MAG TPA: hypothetical protein VII71_03095, partial [Verrucomicrobiae bacterium]
MKNITSILIVSSMVISVICAAVLLKEKSAPLTISESAGKSASENPAAAITSADSGAQNDN